jgi:excisionase family DNA binding protein
VVEIDNKIRPLWPDWLTREEFSRKHGVSVRTLYRWIQSGEAEVSKTAEGKRYRVKELAHDAVGNSESHKVSNRYLGDIALQLTEIARQLGHLATDSRTIARKVDAADLTSVLDFLQRIGEGVDVDPPRVSGAAEEEAVTTRPPTTLKRRFPDKPLLVVEVQRLMEELAAGDLYTPEIPLIHERDASPVVEASETSSSPDERPVDPPPSWREALTVIFGEDSPIDD